MPYGFSAAEWAALPDSVKNMIALTSQQELSQYTSEQQATSPSSWLINPTPEAPPPPPTPSPTDYGLDPDIVNADPLMYSAWMFAQGGGGGVDANVSSWAQDFLSYAGGGEGFNTGAQQFIDYLSQGGFGIGSTGSYGFDVDTPFFDLLAKPSGTGGFISGRSGPALPQTAKFSDIDIQFANAPEWWKALAPDVYNPISEYQTFANLLIPLLSPEDQYTVATNLYQSAPDQFAHLNPETIERSPAALDITPEMRRTYFTGERAQKALDAFDRLLEISGKTSEDLGPGYEFLRGLADTVRDFGLTSGASQLTETQQGQLLSALDPLLAQSKGGALASFGPLAQSFVNPFFSAGSLTGTVRNQFGDVVQPRNPKYL